MNKIFKGLMFGSCTFGLTEFTPASTHARGSRDEALALVKIALIFHETHGLQQAVTEANKVNGQFSHKDLHVMAVDGNGTALAHPDQAKVGKNVLQIHDAKGIFINPEFIKLGTHHDPKGWIRYHVSDRVSKTTQSMEAYVEKHDDVYWVCGYHM